MEPQQPETLFQVMAIKSVKAKNKQEELSFKKGQLISVTSQTEDKYFGSYTGSK